MEKYEAILRTINEKLEFSEKTIEYYRGEVERLERLVVARSKEIETLKKKIEDLTF